jgi:hypothetical protein
MPIWRHQDFISVCLPQGCCNMLETQSWSTNCKRYCLHSRSANSGSKKTTPSKPIRDWQKKLWLPIMLPRPDITGLWTSRSMYWHRETFDRLPSTEMEPKHAKCGFDWRVSTHQ